MPYSRVSIIGAPLYPGPGRRGVDMGPSAMRVANLDARLAALGYEVEDLGNAPVEQAEAASLVCGGDWQGGISRGQKRNG